MDVHATPLQSCNDEVSIFDTLLEYSATLYTNLNLLYHQLLSACSSKYLTSKGNNFTSQLPQPANESQMMLWYCSIAAIWLYKLFQNFELYVCLSLVLTEHTIHTSTHVRPSGTIIPSSTPSFVLSSLMFSISGCVFVMSPINSSNVF